MSTAVSVFAAIFMILGAVGALFSAYFSVYMVAAILLVFSAAFFIVFSVSGNRTKTMTRQAFKDDSAYQAAWKQDVSPSKPAYQEEGYAAQTAYRQEAPRTQSTSAAAEKPVFTEAAKTQTAQKADGDKEAAARSLFKKKADPLPAYKQDLPAAKDEKYMRYCRSCGFIGSQLSTEAVPPCPKCGNPLSPTTTTLDQFTAMSIERRKATVKNWMSI